MMVRIIEFVDGIDWIEVTARAVYLIACIAIGTWLGS